MLKYIGFVKITLIFCKEHMQYLGIKILEDLVIHISGVLEIVRNAESSVISQPERK